MEDRWMVKTLNELHESLQKLITAHRHLLDVVRAEREALLNANLKAVQETTFKKEILINDIADYDADRELRVGFVAAHMRVSPEALTLKTIIREIETQYPNQARSLHSSLNTLTVMVQRISEQNNENKTLAENFLGHLNEMKRNVLGEGQPFTDVYSSQGQKTHPAGTPRLFEKEA